MTETAKNIAETLIEHLPKLGEMQILTMPNDGAAHPAPYVVAVPEGMQKVNLTAEIDAAATRLQPWRRKGTAHLSDLDSFIAWANRNKGDSSAIFADTGPQPSLTCIADYMGGGAPVIDPLSRDPKASHGFHRATYAFPMSREWTIWTAVSGKALTKAELGEFVEENAKDLLDPTPALLNPGKQKAEDWEVKMLDVAAQLQGRFGQYATLMQLSRAFQVNEQSNITTTLNRDTGESSIQFLNEHRDPDGQPIRIPNLFMVAIPVFDNGALYRLPVRFRYRKAGSDVKFSLTLHNADVAFRDALDEAIAAAEAQTELPVFRGAPEA